MATIIHHKEPKNNDQIASGPFSTEVDNDKWLTSWYREPVKALAQSSRYLLAEKQGKETYESDGNPSFPTPNPNFGIILFNALSSLAMVLSV